MPLIASADNHSVKNTIVVQIINAGNRVCVLNHGFQNVHSMQSSAEAEIDSFLARLEKILPKVDTRLILHVMYYERAMRDAHPSAELEIHYKNGTNMERKLEEMRSRFGMASLHGRNGIFVKARMNLATIEEISKDPSVEEIGGMATIASY